MAYTFPLFISFWVPRTILSRYLLEKRPLSSFSKITSLDSQVLIHKSSLLFKYQYLTLTGSFLTAYKYAWVSPGHSYPHLSEHDKSFESTTVGRVSNSPRIFSVSAWKSLATSQEAPRSWANHNGWSPLPFHTWKYQVSQICFSNVFNASPRVKVKSPSV